ncbi:Regulator of chromosome condensation (RCC1) repeat protein [compost metagenome]
MLCWGDNTTSQLAQPAIAGNNRSRTPLEVPAIGDAVEVSAGDDFTCVLRRAGVSCWGANGSSQLGANPAGLGESAIPIPVPLTCP